MTWIDHPAESGAIVDPSKISDDGGRLHKRRGEELPPPRPGIRYVRIPGLGIIIADDDLRHRVEQYFHYPMIILALLALPLIIMDCLFILERNPHTGQAATHGLVWWLVIGGLTVIWIAFTVEFIVKITVAECRIEYVRRNWLDLVIIVIPILRPLRVAAVARTTRVFTLRGVGFKFCRYVFTLVVGMEATDRFLQRLGWKPAVGRADPDKMTRHALISEVRRLRQLHDAWESWYEAERQFLAKHEREPFDKSPPK